MYKVLRTSIPLLSILALPLATSKQSPLMAGQTLHSSQITLSDAMPRSQSIGIFTSLTNDIPNVSTALSSNLQNLTVLAPQDSAIKSLPRKPWEDPEDYGKLGANAYVGQDGVDRAQKNLKRFVEAHVVLESPWKEGEKVDRLSGQGNKLWWEEKDGKKMVSLRRGQKATN